MKSNEGKLFETETPVRKMGLCGPEPSQITRIPGVGDGDLDFGRDGTKVNVQGMTRRAAQMEVGDRIWRCSWLKIVVKLD